ncbi:hypothetical protein D9758_005245 [Tetrapyrgos nigripes]|uniref:Uncharacterized protein n=1 Tax=Tetrapyrgos nigripes TaxID=182062 RepID=A0A8H5LWI2_9AGAR|nr:hypothetical protein D9758_005245 [Tetrapyrgos nigripes]
MHYFVMAHDERDFEADGARWDHWDSYRIASDFKSSDIRRTVQISSKISFAANALVQIMQKSAEKGLIFCKNLVPLNNPDTTMNSSSIDDISNPTTLIPLSPLDLLFVSRLSGFTIGYVLQQGAFSPSSLEAAAIRVLNGWRLLAGWVEFTKNGSYIRVPLGNINLKDRLRFTLETLNVSLDVPDTTHGSAVFPRPSIEFFRDSSVPSNLPAYAETKWPLVSIRITEMTNCFCVGISVPHGVFDIFGFGQIMRGLNAELNGKEWTPPPLFTSNIMKDAFEEGLPSDVSSKEDTSVSTTPSTGPKLDHFPSKSDLVSAATQAFAHFKNTLVPLTSIELIKMFLHSAYERFYHGVETQTVFIDPRTLENMVREVKDEVQASGKGRWVSTNDVLMAWMLKIAHQDEHDNSHKVSAFLTISIRPVLREQLGNPLFDVYTHNSATLAGLPLLTKTEICSMSIADVAYLSRLTIDSVRKDTIFVRSLFPWTNSANQDVVNGKGGLRGVARRSNQSFWSFTSHSIADLEGINFGSDIAALWFWPLPNSFLAPDNGVVFNKFKGGYLVEAVGMRKSRWSKVVKEVERMNSI